MNPPQLANDLEKVPMTRSAWTPVAAAVPAPLRADHSQRVGLVDQQPGVVLLADGLDLGQGRPVAVHRVNAVHRHEDPAGPGWERQCSGRCSSCSAGCGKKPGARRRPGVRRQREKRGPPNRKKRHRPLDQGRDEPEVGGVPRREHQRLLHANPVGQ